jgi:hypothetical protein
MTRPPNYLTALLQHLLALEIEPGTIVHTEVRHDDDCVIWKGKPCDCEPEIETSPEVQKKHGGEYVP